MLPPLPVQRIVAPQGTPPKAQAGLATCVCHTQYSASWPHRVSPSEAPQGVATCVRHAQHGASWPYRELHRRLHWGWPHASATF
eukprot:291440-Pyramimonas_sp.AAC.1